MTNKTIDSRSAAPLVEKSNLINQISHGPTLHEVASTLLRQMLKEKYSDLDIDPNTAQVGSPQWQVINDEIERGPITYETLNLALVRHALGGTTADYLEGEHFLTVEPQVDNPVQLSVDIEEIAQILNEAVALLFIEFQERQLDFWNEKVHEMPRWQKLSESLRKVLDVNQAKGWDADECAMAREIFVDPDRVTRKNVKAGFSTIQACLIDIDIVENGTSRHLVVGGALVIRATYLKRQLITLYTIDRGYESFSSMDALGSSLPERLDPVPKGSSLEWRLFEPDGNVLDHMAWALVSSQIDSIDALKNAEAYAEVPGPEKGLDTREKSRYQQLDAAIPDWLRDAPANDIDDYRRYVTALGKLYRKPKYKTARTEIPPINQYAHKAMCDAIIADEDAAGAASLPWDDLRIHYVNSFTVDNFTLPNPHDQHTETLAEFALENEAPYMATLSFKNGVQVPDWLTPAFLTQVAANIDVGSAYPSYLKKVLIDDATTSQRQANFYRDQLRWLLPLKALEEKIQQTGGIDEQGYKTICTWMESAPGNANPIAVSPLTLMPKHRLISASDTVTNMYIINPRNAANGPCLLYRPLQDVPLMQFPSRQNLIYALHQPGELRDSILAWLANKTLSFEYSQYVFPVGLPSPWLVAEQLVNPLMRADQFGRVVLDTQAMTGDIHTALFRNNAQALITLADRQSQSNAERRWTLLKDSSWALFGVASNLLCGALGTAVWAWQVIEQIQQALDAHEKGDNFNEWKSEADILLSLGILLAHHAVMRRKALSSKPANAHKPLELSVLPAPETTAITLDPVSLSGEIPKAHVALVDAAGSVPRLSPSELVTYLDALEVKEPDLNTEVASEDTDKPSYVHELEGKNYAKVGKRWFNVSVSEDDQVQIVDPETPTKHGPLLVSDPEGRWVIDLRLRLKGGGPKNALRTLKEANARRRIELKEERARFQRKKAKPEDPDVEGSEEQKQNDVAKAQEAFIAATVADRGRLEAVYVEKLEAMISAYQRALEQSREWHALGGGPSYVSESLRMHTELEKYLSFWFLMKKNEYARLTRDWRSDAVIEVPTRNIHLDQVQQVTDLSQAMAEKLVLSREERGTLEALGMPGIERATQLNKLAPSFTEWEIRANEIGISQELCLEEQASATMTQARDDVGNLIVRSAKAAHRIAKFLKKTPDDITPQKQIEELSQLIETFADVDQRFRELPDTYPGHFNQVRIDHLVVLIDDFAKNAQELRSSLLAKIQPSIPKSSAGPSRAPHPKAKVKKTRPRQQTSTETPTTEDAPIGSITLDPHSRQTTVQSDREIVSEALTLSDDAPSFIARMTKDASRPARVPADMQDIFDQQANKLEQGANSVDQVLARTKEFPLSSLSPQLRAAAINMRESGKSVRANLYKLRKPTQSMFRWMHENAMVKLQRDKGRTQTKQLGDYFQEYRILDSKNNDRELWLAHFHYPSLESPVDAPTTAHLKISETYLKTLTEEQKKILTTVEPIDGVFRKIDEPDLRKLFFDLEPKVEV